MPELPEVETMRRGILPVIGSRVAAIEPLQCTRRPISIQPTTRHLRQRTVGQRVTDIERLGKRVAIRLESEDRIIFEPRMTGLILVADPPSVEHLRLRIDFIDGPIRQVWYWDRRGLGNIRLLSAIELVKHFGTDSLGPDALQVSAEELQSRLAASRREIKVALLDQRAIAGIGNLYAAEILHRAGIHPRRRCDQLRLDDWQRLYTAMLEILHDAIHYEGSTLSDGTYRNALNKAGGYQNHHRVYARAGQLCPTCREKIIEQILQAQRSTFFCAKCQRRR